MTRSQLWWYSGNQQDDISFFDPGYIFYFLIFQILTLPKFEQTLYCICNLEQRTTVLNLRRLLQAVAVATYSHNVEGPYSLFSTHCDIETIQTRGRLLSEENSKRYVP